MLGLQKRERLSFSHIGDHIILQRRWRMLLEACDISYRKLYSMKYTDLSILEVAQIVGYATTQMIVQNYGKYIKGEALY